MSGNGSNSNNTTLDWRDLTSPASRRLAGLVRRVAIKMTSSAFWQGVGHLLLDGNIETMEAEVFSGIGFYARPAPDANAEAIVAFPGGASNPAVIATRDEGLRRRVAGGAKQDETWIFNSQVVVQLSEAGLVKAFLIGGPTPVALALKSDVEAVVGAFNVHTHVETGDTTAAIPVIQRAPNPVGSSVLRG